MLEKALLPAIKVFAAERCKMQDLSPLKVELNNLSKHCYSQILQLGSSREGKPLAMITTKKSK